MRLKYSKTYKEVYLLLYTGVKLGPSS